MAKWMSCLRHSRFNSDCMTAEAKRDREPCTRAYRFSLGLIAVASFTLSSPVAAAAESPLANAAEKQDRPSIRTLVQQKADVNVPQADGMTALHWAAHL